MENVIFTGVFHSGSASTQFGAQPWMKKMLIKFLAKDTHVYPYCYMCPCFILHLSIISLVENNLV